ncbi:MAG: hypothetical protein GEV12_23485 [Micromonosporaceae bacterium]|nr:hypothetical protein [Micromonosporaceae bacterium]
MPGRLFADEDTRRFRETQHAALDRARGLPAEQARAEIARLAREEAARRRARDRQLRRDPQHGRGAGGGLAM